MSEKVNWKLIASKHFNKVVYAVKTTFEYQQNGLGMSELLSTNYEIFVKGYDNDSYTTIQTSLSNSLDGVYASEIGVYDNFEYYSDEQRGELFAIINKIKDDDVMKEIEIDNRNVEE